jgi:arylsulfatase A
LAFPAPHTPWLPAPEFEGKSGASMYGDFTNMVDANVGQVLAAVERNKMADNTIVIFTSDNGPVWYDEDVKRFGHDSSGGLRGMKADAWECGHRMPFLVRWPGTVAPGSVTDQTICFTDLLATFAELVETELPASAGPDSFSFLSVLNGSQPKGKPVRDHLVIAAGNNAFTIRNGNWKLINALGSGGFSQPKKVAPKPGESPGQLYDLGSDLGETKNLYLDYPEVVAKLTLALEKIVDSGSSR